MKINTRNYREGNLSTVESGDKELVRQRSASTETYLTLRAVSESTGKSVDDIIGILRRLMRT